MLLLRSVLLIAVFSLSSRIATAQLRFLEPVADLGDVSGPVHKHRCDFVNEGSQPIAITDFRLGCGCLQPSLDKRVHQPGEKGSLFMQVRTVGLSNGPRTWYSRVYYRLGDKTLEAPLLVKAVISSDVSVEPSILAMTIESSLRQEVTITDRRKTPMKVTAVIASSPIVKVSTRPSEKGITKIVLEVNGADLTAPRQEAMLDIYTDDLNYRHVQVPITLLRAERVDVAATPEKVELAGGGSQLVRLRARNNAAVRIDKVEIDNPTLKCTWAAGPGSDATLKISVTAATPGAASIRVRFSEPAGAWLTIPIVIRKD